MGSRPRPRRWLIAWYSCKHWGVGRPPEGQAPEAPPVPEYRPLTASCNYGKGNYGKGQPPQDCLWGLPQGSGLQAHRGPQPPPAALTQDCSLVPNFSVQSDPSGLLPGLFPPPGTPPPWLLCKPDSFLKGRHSSGNWLSLWDPSTVFGLQVSVSALCHRGSLSPAAPGSPTTATGHGQRRYPRRTGHLERGQ